MNSTILLTLATLLPMQAKTGLASDLAPNIGQEALVYYQHLPSLMVSKDVAAHHEMAVAIVANDLPRVRQLCAQNKVLEIPARTRVKVLTIKDFPDAPNDIEAHYSECTISEGPLKAVKVLVARAYLYPLDDPAIVNEIAPDPSIAHLTAEERQELYGLWEQAVDQGIRQRVADLNHEKTGPTGPQTETGEGWERYKAEVMETKNFRTSLYRYAAKNLAQASNPRYRLTEEQVRALVVFADRERAMAQRKKNQTAQAEKGISALREQELQRSVELRRARSRKAAQSRQSYMENLTSPPFSIFDNFGIGGGGGKTVHVRGYNRSNGTYVAPYNRSPPRR